MTFLVIEKIRAEDADAFEIPTRYDETSASELQMMTNAVEVLNYVARVARDCRLSRLLQGFKSYQKFQMTRSRVQFGDLGITQWVRPSDVFEYVIDSSERGLESFSSGESRDIASIMLNLCQYDSPILAKAALTLLKDTRSQRVNLLEDVKQLELTTDDDSQGFTLLKSKLETLRY